MYLCKTLSKALAKHKNVALFAIGSMRSAKLSVSALLFENERRLFLRSLPSFHFYVLNR